MKYLECGVCDAVMLDGGVMSHEIEQRVCTGDDQWHTCVTELDELPKQPEHREFDPVVYTGEGLVLCECGCGLYIRPEDVLLVTTDEDSYLGEIDMGRSCAWKLRFQKESDKRRAAWVPSQKDRA